MQDFRHYLSLRQVRIYSWTWIARMSLGIEEYGRSGLLFRLFQFWLRSHDGPSVHYKILHIALGSFELPCSYSFFCWCLSVAWVAHVVSCISPHTSYRFHFQVLFLSPFAVSCTSGAGQPLDPLVVWILVAFCDGSLCPFGKGVYTSALLLIGGIWVRTGIGGSVDCGALESLAAREFMESETSQFRQLYLN